MRYKVGLLAIAIAVSSHTQCAAYVQQFNANPVGTTCGRINGYTVSTYSVGWLPSGGNPGGYISMPVGTQDARIKWLSVANPSLYSASLGQLLTVDIKVTGSITTPSVPLVRFFISSGANYYFTTDYASWLCQSGNGWNTYSVRLSEASFMPDPHYQNSLAFAQVLAQPTAIGLSFTTPDPTTWTEPTLGFSSTDGGWIMADNFGVIPEPSSISALALGLAVLARRRQAK